MAEPKCPECAISGVENIVSKASSEQSRRKEAWFYVVYCKGCGHVYDVMTKHVFTQTKPGYFVLPNK